MLKLVLILWTLSLENKFDELAKATDIEGKLNFFQADSPARCYLMLQVFMTVGSMVAITVYLFFATLYSLREVKPKQKS